MSPFDHVTLINLYLTVVERPQELRSSPQALRSSSASCFKYFVIGKISKICKKDICSSGSWPTCRLLYLYMKQLINSRAISPLTFFFKNSFLILKHISKTATRVVIKNKLLLKLSGILPGTHQYWSLFLIKLQALRTFTRLIFYIDYKDFIFLQVKPCKAMLIEAYLEPSRTSTLVKPYFRNVINLIQWPLGSIFYTTNSFVKIFSTVKTSGEEDFLFQNYTMEWHITRNE